MTFPLLVTSTAVGTTQEDNFAPADISTPPNTKPPLFLRLWEMKASLDRIVDKYPVLGMAYPFKDHVYCHADRPTLATLSQPDLLANIQSARIEKLKMVFPSTTFQVGKFGQLQIAEGTILKLTDPLIMGEGGQILSGTFEFFTHQPEFEVGGIGLMKVRGLQFEDGHVKVLRGGSDIRPLAPIEKIGITKPIKDFFGIPMENPFTLGDFLNGPKNKKDSEANSGAISSLVNNLNLKFVEFKGHLEFSKPFAFNAEENPWIEASEINVETTLTAGLPEIHVTLNEPKLAANLCQSLVVAKKLHLWITPDKINLSQKLVSGTGALAMTEGAIKIPGRLSKEPIYLNAMDTPQVQFNFEFSPEKMHLSYTNYPFAVMGESEELSLDLHANKGGGSLDWDLPTAKLRLQAHQPVQATLNGLITPALIVSSVFFCNTQSQATNPPLLMDAAFQCTAENAYVEWWDQIPTPEEYDKDPKKYQPRAVLDLPLDGKKELAGKLHLEPGFFQLLISSLKPGMHLLDVYGIAGGFDLEGKGVDGKTLLENLEITQARGGEVRLGIGNLQENIDTILSSIFLKTSVFSDLKITQARGWVDPNTGNLEMHAGNPTHYPYFLETKATGSLDLLKMGIHIPLDKAALKIEVLTYDHKTSEVLFSGDIFLGSHLIPDQLFKTFPLHVLDGVGKSQEFTVRIHAKEVILNKSGLAIPNNVTITVEAAHKSAPPIAYIDPSQILKPTLYPYRPQLEEKATETKAKSWSEVAMTLAKPFVNRLQAINDFSVILPHSQGDLGFGFFWPDAGNIFFNFNTAPDRLGHEQIKKLELTTDGAPKACWGKVGDTCAFVPDLEFKGAHLTTQNDPYREDTPLIESPPVPQKKAGNLLFSFDTLSDKSLAFLTSFPGFQIDDLVPTRIPIDFNQAKAEILGRWAKLTKATVDAQKKEGPSLAETLRLDASKTAFNIDLSFTSDPLNLAPTPLGDFKIPRVQMIFDDKARLHAMRHPDVLNHIYLDQFGIKHLEIEAPSSEQKKGSFFWMDGLTLEKGFLEMRPDGLDSHLKLHIDDISFELSKFQGSIHHFLVSDPLLLKIPQGKSSSQLVGAKEISAQISLIKEEGNVQINFETAQINPFVKLHPNLIEFGASKFKNHEVSIIKNGFGLVANALNIDGFRGFIPLTEKETPGSLAATSLDDEKPYRFDARHLSIQQGALLLTPQGSLLLTSTVLRLDNEAHADNVALEVHKDGKIIFEATNADFFIDNPLTDFFKNIPFSGDADTLFNQIPFVRDTLFEGLQKLPIPQVKTLQSIQLKQIHVKGNFVQSSLENGDLTLQGDFSLETEGKIHMTYNGFHFDTTVKIKIPHIYRLVTRNKHLDEILFEKAEISFDQLFAQLNLKNTFSGGIGSKDSFIHVTIPHGHYKKSDENPDAPWLDMPDVEVTANIRPRGTTSIKKIKMSAEGDTKLHTHFGVKANGHEKGEREYTLTVYDFKSDTLLKSAKTVIDQK